MCVGVIDFLGKKVSPDSVLKQKPVLAVDDLRMAAMQNKADVVRQCINSGKYMLLSSRCATILT